jgi:hypothetical protein
MGVLMAASADAYRLHGESTYSEDITSLAYRRSRPFLDRAGLQTRSLEHLMAEAYMQGIKDAADAVSKRRV